MITLKTYDRVKQREVVAGKYDEVKKIFTKRVKDCHYMRKTKSYGIQSDVVERLLDLDCLTVQIKTDDGTYTSDLYLWACSITAELLDFGHGLQNHLGVRHMQYTKKRQRKV